MKSENKDILISSAMGMAALVLFVLSITLLVDLAFGWNELLTKVCR